MLARTRLSNAPSVLVDDNVVLMTVEDGRNGRRLRFGNRGHFFDDHALSLALSARPAGGQSNYP